MRVVTFRHETEERLGFLVDDQVVDPKRVADQAGEAAYDNAIAFIRAGEETRRAAISSPLCSSSAAGRPSKTELIRFAAAVLNGLQMSRGGGFFV